MQENLQTQTPVIKPSQSTWYISLALLIVVGSISAFFAISSWMREGDIVAIQDETISIEKQITTIGTDRKILIANIVKNNTLRPSLDLKPIIQQFRTAAAKANVRLKGFAIVDDVISTTLIATEGDSGVHPDPVATIVKMMREYASSKTEFSLEPIYSISGDPTMRTTGIKFHVLSSNIR